MAAITQGQIVKAIHLGTKRANQKYEKWSWGAWLTDAGVEGLLASCIAETVHENQRNEYGSLTMETTFKDIVKWSGAAPHDNIASGNRVDIVLWNGRASPICVIEVKRCWTKKTCLTDLNRIDSLVRELAYRNNGSLKRGFLALMIAKKATKQKTADEKIREQKNKIMNIIGEELNGYDGNKIRHHLSRTTRMGQRYRAEYGDWDFASLCIEIYASNS